MLASGCAYQTPPVRAPERMSAGPLTAAAVDVVGGDEAIAREVGDEVKADVADMLARAVPADAGTPTPVRVRVRILADRMVLEEALRQDGFAGIGLAGFFLGQVTDEARVEVGVWFDVLGRTRAGHAVVSKEGSVYAPARRRALAAALDLALARASEATCVEPSCD